MSLWRLSKQSLPTEDVRAHGKCLRRVLAVGAPDSWCHSLLECTISRCTWALVDEELGSNLVATTETRAKSWLFNLMESLPHEQFILTAVTLWAIWTSRRKAIHEVILQTPHAIKAFITRFISDLEAVRTPRQPRPVVANTGSLVLRPKAPPAIMPRYM